MFNKTIILFVITLTSIVNAESLEDLAKDLNWVMTNASFSNISSPAFELYGSEQTQKPKVFRCTIFYASDGMTVLAGNNEDWSDPKTAFRFIPSSEGKHGWIKFGYAGGYPQGGMNDQGLFWDATGCAYLEMPFSEVNKEKYSGALMIRVMEECSSVQEARTIFENYYCDDQYRAQYLIGDTTGASMIVEGDSIIEKSSNYQVATNFYQSHPELGGYPCWRYDTALSSLQNSTELSTYLFGSILSATHQEGKYPTQYSNIYDLKQGIIYLFHFHNFEEFIKINLSDELGKGNRIYDMPILFSEIQTISPKEDTTVNASSVTFKWNGKNTSTYDLCYSMDPNFRDYDSVFVEASQSDSYNRTFFGTVLIGLVAMGGAINRKSKRYVVAILTICALSLFLINCNDEITGFSNSGIDEFNVTIDNLELNSTYYWKVIVHPGGIKDFSSESIVQTFNTDN